MYANAAALNVDSYWNLLKGLSENEKLQLITRLSSSMLKNIPTQTKKASDFYGVWSDDDFEGDADSMVNEIKTSRRFKDSIGAF